MNKFKKNKGITLVALIITVVILLILAVVSIRAVTGDGIITKAKSAKSEYEIAQEKEEIQLGLLEWQLVQKNGEPTLKDYLKDKYGEGNIQPNADGSVTVTLPNGNRYVVSSNGDVIYLDGTVEEPEPEPEREDIFKTITATNYGDKIEYNDPAGVNDWKVFYKDADYLYIITSDYLENTKLPSGLKMSKIGNYGIAWYDTDHFTSAGASDITSEIANKYKLNWWKDNKTSINYNARATADLLNIEAWTAKFGDSSKGIEAIGGPTLEMWVESWNEYGNTKLYLKYNENGYFIGSTINPESSFYVPLSGDVCENLEFYYLRGNTDGYVLASPGKGNSDSIMYVGELGSFKTSVLGLSCAFLELADGNAGLRPLVSIPKDLVTTNASGNLAVVQ